MREIVKNLRDLALMHAEAMPPGWRDSFWLYTNAADRIEALEAEVASLRDMLSPESDA